jgi:hypothetical protein
VMTIDDEGGGVQNVLKFDDVIYGRTQNLASKAISQLQNAPKFVWRPGSARTRWGSSQRSPDPQLNMGGRFAAGRGGEEEREDGEGKARERLKGRETREGRGREGKGHREGRDRKVGEGKGAGADGIAGGQNVSTPSINYWLRHWYARVHYAYKPAT